jgi:hypothetical protein
MADAAATLLQRLRAAREFWVELDDAGRAVLVRRPAETEILRLRHGINLQDAAAAVVGWRGFTEAHLLGPKLGSDSPAAFAPELAAEVLGDNLAWSHKVAGALAQAIDQHLTARAAAEKN